MSIFSLFRLRLVRPAMPFAALLSVASWASAQTYLAVDLGSLGGTTTTGTAINNLGVVVGASNTPNGNSHAFVYSNGVMTDLAIPLNGYTGAASINDSGLIAGSGYANANTFSQPFDAFVYNQGTATIITTPGGTIAAQALNSSGTLVGGYATDFGNTHFNSYTYNNGTLTTLPSFGGNANVTYALGINDSGTIVGYYFLTTNQSEHGFVYSNGTMSDLGTLLGGATSNANFINNAGVIVGVAQLPNGDSHAFSYFSGATTDLGTLGGVASWANAVNGSGLVVGYATTGSGAQHAFVYNNGAMSDLNLLVNLPGVTLNNATAINNAGQIVANASNGHAFLLTTTSVPEPSAFALLAGSLLLLCAWCRRSGFSR